MARDLKIFVQTLLDELLLLLWKIFFVGILLLFTYLFMVTIVNIINHLCDFKTSYNYKSYVYVSFMNSTPKK